MSRGKDDFEEFYEIDDQQRIKSETEELIRQVKDVARDVYATLGGGHGERVYHQAMAAGFRHHNILYRTKPKVEIFFKREHVGAAEPDFIVDDRLVVELKITKEDSVASISQTKAYLRTLKIWNGIVVNFPPAEPKPRFELVANDSANTQATSIDIKEPDEELLDAVKKMFENNNVHVTRRMRSAVDASASARDQLEKVKAEYECMLSKAGNYGFSQDEIEASENLNWRRVKPSG